jgi:uncharacterized membrane protein (TIGR02234 family)
MAAPDPADRRQLARTLLFVLLGSGLILAVAGRSWATVTVPRQPPFGALRLALSGRDLYPPLTALAVVALIVAVLVVAVSGWPRRLLGVLLILLGCGTGDYAIRGIGRPGTGRILELAGDRLGQRSGGLQVQLHRVWPWLGAAGSFCLLVAGLWLLLRPGVWRFGMSARYAAPAEAAAATDPWRQLDRGEDPTMSRAEDPTMSGGEDPTMSRAEDPPMDRGGQPRSDRDEDPTIRDG